jgi:hypothetical protein
MCCSNAGLRDAPVQQLLLIRQELAPHSCIRCCAKTLQDSYVFVSFLRNGQIAVRDLLPNARVHARSPCVLAETTRDSCVLSRQNRDYKKVQTTLPKCNRFAIDQPNQVMLLAWCNVRIGLNAVDVKR